MNLHNMETKVKCTCLAIPLPQLEELLGLSPGSIRSLNYNFMHNRLEVLTDDDYFEGESLNAYGSYPVAFRSEYPIDKGEEEPLTNEELDE